MQLIFKFIDRLFLETNKVRFLAELSTRKMNEYTGFCYFVDSL